MRRPCSFTICGAFLTSRTGSSGLFFDFTEFVHRFRTSANAWWIPVYFFCCCNLDRGAESDHRDMIGMEAYSMPGAYSCCGPRPDYMNAARITKVVLYVEDDAEHRELMRAAAKASHVKFALAMAHGLYDSMDYLGGQGKYADRLRYPLPAFVIADYALGSFKGTELVRWIRKQVNLSSLPVVMFSGCSEVPQMAECYAAGADYYIKKPQRFEDLLTIVRGLEASLEHNPPRVSALAEMAADPTVDSEALKAALSDGLAYDSVLREHAHARLAKLDLTIAVREQTRKPSSANDVNPVS